MIELANIPEAAKVLELGGGANRHPRANCNVDAREGPGVDFPADFNAPLPMQDAEWDVVLCSYCLEHLSWRKVGDFLKEVFRVCKPGATVAFETANVEAQLQWIKDHPDGWDERPFFESASGVLFGDCDYPENSHKCFMTPATVTRLFADAGFLDVTVVAARARNTDLHVTAKRPWGVATTGWPEKYKAKAQKVDEVKAQATGIKSGDRDQVSHIIVLGNVAPTLTAMDMRDRAGLFDKHYFNGGGKVGGYAREGYRDFPIHEVTARHILARKPSSVLELGCARGYVLKRIQDAGVPAHGLEVSRHCYLTRACENIRVADLCATWEPWGMAEHQQTVFDLCYSVATMEHIPEQFIPVVIQQMARFCRRGLHGVDFGHKDDGFDKTHCSLFPKERWLELFAQHAPGWPVEIVDKEELERGQFPQEVMNGDGKVKLNVGSHMQMFHHGWVNIDHIDLAAFAQGNGYKFEKRDVRNGLPYGTGTVDLIFTSHFLEHLTYDEGRKFLMECRRVLKPSTASLLRVLVPDAGHLQGCYAAGDMDQFSEISDGCEKAPTQMAKLWELLHAGHNAAYDEVTLDIVFRETGFNPSFPLFRQSQSPQMLKETVDGFPCLSLIAEASPHVG